MSGIKKFLLLLSVLILGAGASVFLIKLPTITSNYNVKKSITAPNFDYETYEGWAFAYNALKRENNVLYSKAPTKKKELAEFTAKGYPNKWLPDLMEDYGIAVQKPYAGNYIFKTQKDNLSKFYKQEGDIVTKGLDTFKPLSKEVNANDANVIKALNEYMILIDRTASATAEMTLQESKDIPIGEYIHKSVGEEVFSEPLGYGQVAIEYLENNLNKYKGNYEAFVNNSDNQDKLNGNNVPEVKAIMGIAN